MLGGLIGLGGAEFRLHVLKGAFGHPAHDAVPLNLAFSLVTLLAALAFRIRPETAGLLEPLLPVLGALIAGSTTGAWIGASAAGRLSPERLEQLILVLLVGIGGLLMVEGFVLFTSGDLPAHLGIRVPTAIVLGGGIGLVSSLLGVAGGEVIIPTLMFVFGADIKVAGTASVMVSVPTVIVGLARYARKGAFKEKTHLRTLVAPMGLGSIVGAAAGGYLVPLVSCPH